MLTFILEAALRSMLMAAAVWAVIRVLRVQAVIAQKIAWVLVLVATAVMPLVMHSPWLALKRTVQVPVGGLAGRQLAVEAVNRLIHSFSFAGESAAPEAALSDPALSGAVQPAQERIAAREASPMARPYSASHITAPAGTHPAQSVVLHEDLSQKPSERPSVLSHPSRIIYLPVAPMELSVKLPVALPARVSFWTASRIRLVVILLYAAVVAALLLRIGLGLIFALRLFVRSRKVQFLSGSGQGMRVRSSPELTTPVTIGSTILLPSGYAAWDAEKLRVVLAHEHSHVRQGDFYLQLAAGIHAAVFWFSPLGWWLKRKLSDLGEALSDRAALAQAQDAASYAQILLEFAAAPRRVPLAGVAIARSSNLSSRIERILNDRRFRLAFLGGRRHAILAAALVPAALVIAVAGIRIVPPVHAESTSAATILHRAIARSAGVNCDQGSSVALAQTIASENLQDSNAVVATTLLAQAAAPVAPVAPTAPNPPTPEAVAPVTPPEPPPAPEDPDEDSQNTGKHKHSHTIITHGGDDDESFSIIHEKGDGGVRWNGEYNEEIAKTRKQMGFKGDYIWFERNGQSYVITDPAIVAQADSMFREDPALERQQKEIEQKQKVLEKQMADFSPEKVKINVDTPEFRKQMADLNAQLAKLQSEEFKKHLAELNKQINQEVLAKLQEQMGNIQEQIGQLQGQIGEQMGKYGEEQGRLGEQMGRLGEEMGRIGEEQGRRAEEAARKMQSVIDQAMRDGKAKPVE